MSELTSSILGCAPSYPFRFGQDGLPVVEQDESLVLAALRMLFDTEIGEMPYLVRDGVPYGVRARRALFENIDKMRDILAYEYKKAVDVWEPRVVVLGVEAVQSGKTAVKVTILFRYRSTSRPDNLVVMYSTKE